MLFLLSSRRPRSFRCCRRLSRRGRQLGSHRSTEVARAEDAPVLRPQFQCGEGKQLVSVNHRVLQLAGLEAVLFAPLPKRDEDDVQLLALAGQDVAVAGRGTFILDCLKDAFLDEFFQSRREDVPGESEGFLKLAEAVLPAESLANNE